MDREDYRRRLAAKLRGARAEADLSQKQVEQATGISTSHLSRVENGSEAIDFEELLQLAGLYDVPLGKLVEDFIPLEEPPSATRASSNGANQDQAA